jgi:hypothetical protein
MSLAFYKPKKDITGHGCSFRINLQKSCLFLSFIKQANWNEKNKKDAFRPNINKPGKTANVKISEIEIGGIIDCILTNRPFSAFHSFESRETKLNFTPYIVDENIQKGFGLGIATSNSENTQEAPVKFFIGLKCDEAQALRVYLEEGLRMIYREKILESQFVEDKPTPPKTETKPAPEEDDLEDVF